MKQSHFGATVALILAIVVLFVAPAHIGVSTQYSGAASSHVAAPRASPLAILANPAAPSPLLTFPRTVLVETFTGVWCHFCPEETQALHYIDLSTDRSVLAIAELHVCAFPPGSGPCLENYVPPDGTSDARGAFYNVCGFPNIFFDGAHQICGKVGTTAQTQVDYENYIANASSYPGNVSIAETAVVSGTNVVVHANVTSGLSGTYNAVSYLLELIDKLNQSNGYGPHDVDRVVRATLVNHPVSLVAGATTEIDATGAIAPTWNDLNFSVVTFIQQNSTKIIENANFVPVNTLSTAVSINRTTLLSGGDATLTLHVANTTTGLPVAGGAVTLTSSAGGLLTPTSGVTASDGSFTATYKADTVLASTNVVITAQIVVPGYTVGTGSVTLVVNPIIVPLVPTGLTLGPGVKEVTLNWTQPGSGGVGLTYHIFRGTSQAGPYTEIGASDMTDYNDTGLAGGQSYWYKVSAQNSGGFSANTTQIGATGVTIGTQGLPQHVGWWISVDSLNVSSRSNGSLALYLPVGFFGYDFGPGSYAYVASGNAGPLAVAHVPLYQNVTFVPRYATLQGTVSPANAIVTLNGAPFAVASGSFGGPLVAGTYSLNISADGFVTNLTSVTLTPGNVTTLAIQLQHVAPGPGSSAGSFGGLSGANLLVVIGGAVAAVAIIIGAIALSARGKRGRTGGARPNGPQPSSEIEEAEP